MFKKIKQAIAQLEARQQEYEQQQQAYEQRQQDYEQQHQAYKNTCELTLADYKEQINHLSNQCESVAKKVAYLEELLEGYESFAVNLRNNNAQLDLIKQDIDMLNVKMKKVGQKAPVNVSGNQPIKQESSQIQKVDNVDNSYETIDYFDFENHFRGSREAIKERQKEYLKYFENCNQVVDIGCGRGEFLELLKEHHIGAVGVDAYEEFADYCKDKDLQAVAGDGIEYLQQVAGTDGVFVGQVVEHLKVEQIIALCNAAYEKLSQGGYLVIETPNPTSLAIYTHAFYVDPSHVKPVHPLTMQYLLEKAGFKDIQIIYTETSKLETSIPEIKISDAEGIESFNEAMKIVSNTLFGSQDYAIIARR